MSPPRHLMAGGTHPVKDLAPLLGVPLQCHDLGLIVTHNGLPFACGGPPQHLLGQLGHPLLPMGQQQLPLGGVNHSGGYAPLPNGLQQRQRPVGPSQQRRHNLLLNLGGHLWKPPEQQFIESSIGVLPDRPNRRQLHRRGLLRHHPLRQHHARVSPRSGRQQANRL